MAIPKLDDLAFVIGDHDTTAETQNRLSYDFSYDFLADDDASQFGFKSV
jgi:hypothetical protein